MRKYDNFAPIGLKSGFVDVIHQFDIVRFLSFAGLPRKWGMKALCFRRCKGQY